LRERVRVRGGHKIKPSMRFRLELPRLKTPHPNPLPQGERESDGARIELWSEQGTGGERVRRRVGKS
jgi:hypothetical protein